MAVKFIIAAFLLQYITVSSSLDNGLVQRPPMGWMSWARFTCQVDCSIYPNDCINEKLFRDMADELVAGGYLDAGYEYVNIDDCWSEMTREPKTNMLLANATRFPSGIPALSKYIHRKGLKFGKNLYFISALHSHLSYCRNVWRHRNQNLRWISWIFSRNRYAGLFYARFSTLC